MNPDKQRIAIAEACGVVWRQAEDGWWDRVGPHPWSCGLSWEAVLRNTPDYLSDLNAMHKAEKEFYGSDEDWEEYFSILSAICRGDSEAAHATAAQRAEAFLRATGKWEDSP